MFRKSQILMIVTTLAALIFFFAGCGPLEARRHHPDAGLSLSLGDQRSVGGNFHSPGDSKVVASDGAEPHSEYAQAEASRLRFFAL